MNYELNLDAQPKQAEDVHEVLMQLEAIIFASDVAVSVARLKEAFQDRYSKQEIRQFLQQLTLLQHGRSIELVETVQGTDFKFVRNIVILLYRHGLNDQLGYRHRCSKHSL